MSLKDKNILLIITGGIAAYKALELIRLIRKAGGNVQCVLTKGGAQFVTPLSLSALSENPVYSDLWSLKEESEMGHIRLSREADVIVIAPASADFLAKMVNGFADDLASTTLLAADKPVLFAPAMNHKMWDHPATQNNAQKLVSYGYRQIGPDRGDMACGEHGFGRMAEPEEILKSLEHFFNPEKPLRGKKAIVTAGPTLEPIDPVRYLSNHSSGKQGYAIAEALHDAGADVTLISGPTTLPPLQNISIISVQTAAEMLKASEKALPADIAVCTAAVCDWRLETSADQKLKKTKDQKTLKIELHKSDDVLQTLSTHEKRPDLVIGFAAETENLEKHAKEKLKAKQCDWILANDVSAAKVFGRDENHVVFFSHDEKEDWGKHKKSDIAKRLVEKIIEHITLNKK